MKENERPTIKCFFLVCLLCFSGSCSVPSKSNASETIDSDEDIPEKDMETYEEEDDTEDYDEENSDADIELVATEISQKNPVSYEDSNPYGFVAFSEGEVLFSAYTNHEGTELWRSDGTSIGTFLVKDVFPGPVSSNPSFFVNAGEVIFFTASEMESVPVLFRTDGTAQGTFPVTTPQGDLIPVKLKKSYSNDNLFENYYALIGSEFYFFSINSEGESVLMRVEQGKKNAETLDIFKHVSAITGYSKDGVFFIAADDSGEWKLWKYDISAKQSSVVYDLEYSEGEIKAILIHRFLDKFVFSITYLNEGENNISGRHIFISDGTEKGTSLISEDYSALEVHSDSNGVYIRISGTEILFNDGTGSETSLIKIENSGSVEAFDILNDKQLLITGYEEKEFSEIPVLYVYDIEKESLELFHPFESLSDSSEIPIILKYGEDWYMIDGEFKEEFYGITVYYDYLYRLDFNEGTKTKIASPVNVSSSNFRDYVRYAGVHAGKIWISGSVPGKYGTSGYEVIVSDGTNSGTHLVKTLNLKRSMGGDSFYPLYHNGQLFFNMTIGDQEYLQKIDISSKSLKTKLISGSNRISSSHSAIYRDRVFISSYKKAATGAGTGMLSAIDYIDNTLDNIREGYNYDIASAEEGVVFISSDDSGLRNLYVTDGTQTGTHIIKAGNSAPINTSHLFQNSLYSYGGKVIFFYMAGNKDDGVSYEMWVTNGKKEETFPLMKDIHTHYYDPHQRVICDNSLMFSSQTYESKFFQVYLTGMTPENTYIVFRCDEESDCSNVSIGCADKTPLLLIQHRSESKVSFHTVSKNGKLNDSFAVIPNAFLNKTKGEVFVTGGSDHFFALHTEEKGLELWKTDGTEKGTLLIKDINSGREGSNPDFFGFREPYIYFKASDGTHGYELWRSDGTAENTELFLDLNTGAGSSSIEEAVLTEEGLFINGTGTEGLSELWFIPFGH